MRTQDLFDELGLLSKELDARIDTQHRIVDQIIEKWPRDDQSLITLHDHLSATGARFYPVWRANGLPRKAELYRRVRTAHLYAPNRADGSWVGSLNPDGTVTYPVPPRRLPVVYVLRSALGHPVYVGHTTYLRRRLDQHSGRRGEADSRAPTTAERLLSADP